MAAALAAAAVAALILLGLRLVEGLRWDIEVLAWQGAGCGLAAALLTVVRWRALIAHLSLKGALLEALYWGVIGTALILVLSAAEMGAGEASGRPEQGGELVSWLWRIPLLMLGLLFTIAWSSLLIGPLLVPAALVVIHVARAAYRLAGGPVLPAEARNSPRRLEQRARSARRRRTPRLRAAPQ